MYLGFSMLCFVIGHWKANTGWTYESACWGVYLSGNPISWCKSTEYSGIFVILGEVEEAGETQAQSGVTSHWNAQQAPTSDTKWRLSHDLMLFQTKDSMCLNRDSNTVNGLLPWIKTPTILRSPLRPWGFPLLTHCLPQVGGHRKWQYSGQNIYRDRSYRNGA